MFTASVDSILKVITKQIYKLDKLKEELEYQQEVEKKLASAALQRSEEHKEEASRAVRVADRLRGLVA